MPDLPENLSTSMVAEIFSDYILPWSINLAFAVAIFFIGRYITKLIVRLVRRLLSKAKTDPILVNFVCSIANWLLFLFIVVAALDQLGVNTTSLIAVMGAAGLAVGLAMQNSLQNFAAGVLMIIFRPFSSGDYVEAGGVSGTVEEINIFSTVLRTPDNREVIVPNGSIYGGNIVNYSAKPTRRIDLVFGIGYTDDIQKAKDTIKSILEAEKRIHKDPAPFIAVAELADSSVNLYVRPWVNTSDYWAVRCELTEKVKLAFDEKSISIPFPQMDVHLENVA